MASPPPPRHQLRLVLDEHERERSDLARELHEHVAQALAAVLLGLDSLGSGDSEGPPSRLAGVRTHVAETLEHCRALAVALRPPLLDQLGLVPALEQLAERGGVERMSIDPALAEAALSPALRTDVYRSVEEALASAAGSPSLAISLDPTGRELRISVRPPDASAALGVLEARLALVGGTLTASSAELLVRIPRAEGGDGASAAFPQSARVEIPDGDPRALP